MSFVQRNKKDERRSDYDNTDIEVDASGVCWFERDDRADLFVVISERVHCLLPVHRMTFQLLTMQRHDVRRTANHAANTATKHIVPAFQLVAVDMRQ